METLLRALANSLLLPPGINIILLIIGLILLQRFHTTGMIVIILSTATLYLMSTAIIASRLIAPLQHYPAINLTQVNQQQPEQAIVVLTGGGRYAPEYQRHQPSHYSMMRELYAADLYKATKLPILIVGGKGSHSTVPESEMMQQHLAKHFDTPTTWIELNSRNTWENAQNTKQYLTQHNITSFYLVTSAWHMPRALCIFNKIGFKPTPAPTDYLLVNGRLTTGSNWLPSARMLLISRVALHEYFAKIWACLYSEAVN